MFICGAWSLDGFHRGPDTNKNISVAVTSTNYSLSHFQSRRNAENGNVSKLAENGNVSKLAKNGNVSNLAENSNVSKLAENGKFNEFGIS